VYGDQLPSEQAWTDLLTRVVTALMPPG